MAVHAAAVEHPAIGEELRGRARIRIGLRGVARLVVALLAQPGLLGVLHPRVEGTVRIVAVQTVLAHRWVFPQHRRALLGMTRVAVLVDRVLEQQRGAGGAVRVVARRAVEPPFAQRHVSRAHQRRLALQMARAAGLELVARGEQSAVRGRLRLVDLVAGEAGQPAALVWTPLPARMRSALVAGEANGRLLGWAERAQVAALRAVARLDVRG